MRIASRFGLIDVDADAVLEFPGGIWGFEQCQRWILLADPRNDALAWLQSIDRTDVALPVTSPRRYVPDYRIRVAKRELASLELADLAGANVLVVVGRTARGLSLNLKAPILLNLQRRLGRQVLTNGEMPVRYELGNQPVVVRRSA